MFPKLTIVGGTAVRTSDAWCLALQGKSSTENVKDPKTALKNNGVIDLEDRRTLIADADLNRIPKDAKSLNTWLSQARKL